MRRQKWKGKSGKAKVGENGRRKFNLPFAFCLLPFLLLCLLPLAFCLLPFFAFAVEVKVTELPADTSPTSDDLIMTVNSPGGTPVSKKVILGDAITKAHGLGDGILKIAGALMADAIPGTDYLSPLGPLTIIPTFGSNLSPIDAGCTGWTLGAGWSCGGDGTLYKNADGVGTATYNAGEAAGAFYVIGGPVTIFSVGTFKLDIGSIHYGQLTWTSANGVSQTVSEYFYSGGTTDFSITPSSTSRFKIVPTVKVVTNGGGTFAGIVTNHGRFLAGDNAVWYNNADYQPAYGFANSASKQGLERFNDNMLVLGLGSGTGTLRFVGSTGTILCTLGSDGVVSWFGTPENAIPAIFASLYNGVARAALGMSVTSQTATSGSQKAFAFGGDTYMPLTFSPTSGNASFTAFELYPTINQTGGASGSYTVLKINALETAVGGSANRLISAGTGGGSYAEKFGVDPTGKMFVQYTANSTVATTITSLGPAGAATTIQGWIKVYVNGADHWIPFW